MSDEYENFNETDSTGNDSGGDNFNETKEVDNEAFNETDNVNSASDEGNFNEVENSPSDSSSGNFNEVGNITKSLSNSNIENTGSLPDSSMYSTDYSVNPGGTPQKGGSPKALIGVVVALGLVIIGLIIFLIVSIANKKNEEVSNPEPTTVLTEISVDGTPQTTGSDSDNGSEKADSTDNSSTSGSNGLDIQETPAFNVTVELGQYRGIEVDYEQPEVTDEDVQGAIDYFVSTLEEKESITDRPLAEGDIVLVDFVGTIDGEVFDGGSATGAEIELGSHKLLSGFEEGLIGKNVGDTVSLDLTFPDPYNADPDLSGKPVNFLVNINEGYLYVTPELTDELVAENSDYETIAEYREAARQELEEEAVEYADSKVKNDIIQKIIENSKFGGQIEEQIAYEVDDCINYYDSICMQNFGIDGATYFGYLWGITEEEYLAMVNEESTMSVKYNAILDEIAKKENLTVSDEEYEDMFQETFIDNWGFESKEEVFEQLNEDEVKKTVNGYVLHDKAESIIFDSAIINK